MNSDTKFQQIITEINKLAYIKEEFERIFLFKIFQNDFEYVKEHYTQIKNLVIKHTSLLLAAMYSKSVTMLSFIINVFEYDDNNIHTIVDIKNTNCLLLACRNNTNIEIIKYLIEDIKMIKDHHDKNGNNCLNLACAYNPNLDIIKYLIEKVKMDKNKYNISGNNCLMMACMENTNLEIITYLVESCGMNTNYLNSYNDNCLTSSCWKNTNLEIIKYLIEKVKMNTNHCDNFGNNCLMLACLCNKNLEIVKYLIEKVKMDINKCNDTNVNCLMMACYKNTNLEIIRYLVETGKVNTGQCDHYGENCLMQACEKNKNPEIIKYLIEKVKMNPQCYNVDGDTCLANACKKNKNLEIIKYLIEEAKIDTEHCNYYGNNCLMLACWKNKNPEIVKYLIEVIKMKPSKYNNKNDDNCLTLAFKRNKNETIIAYLLEHSKIQLTQISLKGISTARFEWIVPIIEKNIKNYHIFNDFLKKTIESIKEYGDKVISTIFNVNPILLNKKVCSMINVKNPFDNSYSLNEFILTFEKLKCTIDYQKVRQLYEGNENKNEDAMQKESSIENTKNVVDLTEKSSLLFKHNNIDYYGNRTVIYNKIYVLNDLQEYDLKDPIVLNVDVPEYIMQLYIQSCYEGSFDLNKVLPKDFYFFLNLIDKYPTRDLSIDLLEMSLIKYMEENSIPFDNCMKDFCLKYRLKYMYLYGYYLSGRSGRNDQNDRICLTKKERQMI
jgi:hypothetical protein